jgi:DNA-binding PucR family transcriptional regulator
MNERKKPHLAETYDKYIIVLMQEPNFSELEQGIEDEFLEAHRHRYKSGSKIVLACFPLLRTPGEIREYYDLFEKTWLTANIIFPVQHKYSIQELRFAQQCKNIVAEGEMAVSQYLLPLRPLMKSGHQDDLLKTLKTFLLDAASNVNKTADIMYLHKNSIKYRINSIKKALSYDFMNLPGSYDIYLAAALHRLVENGELLVGGA